MSQGAHGRGQWAQSSAGDLYKSQWQAVLGVFTMFRQDMEKTLAPMAKACCFPSSLSQNPYWDRADPINRRYPIAGLGVRRLVFHPSLSSPCSTAFHEFLNLSEPQFLYLDQKEWLALNGSLHTGSTALRLPLRCFCRLWGRPRGLCGFPQQLCFVCLSWGSR